jgi:hypothetical protein
MLACHIHRLEGFCGAREVPDHGISPFIVGCRVPSELLARQFLDVLKLRLFNAGMSVHRVRGWCVPHRLAREGVDFVEAMGVCPLRGDPMHFTQAGIQPALVSGFLVYGQVGLGPLCRFAPGSKAV